MHSKKIILLDPLGYGDRFLRHAHFLRDLSGFANPGYVAFPPLDLMYAASYLKKYGHDTQIIEGSIKHISHTRLVKIIKEKRPDFVLIPSTYPGLSDEKYLSRLIRKSVPGIRIIFSGPLVTYDPSLVLSDGSADFVALGELELPLLNILNGNYSQNVAYRKEGGIFCGERTLLDLAELPLPARELIDNNAYRYVLFNRSNPVTAMSISRGCLYSQCRICNCNLFTLGQIRYRSIDAIIDEIREIVCKYKIREIFFRDQAFTANKELVRKICTYIISNDINIYWRCTTRVDLVDQDILKLMHQAGCYQISFGFESHSQKFLDRINKGITVEQSKQAAHWAKESGMEVMGLFVFGLSGDTAESIRESFNFALNLKVDYAQFNSIVVVPGTQLYEQSLTHGPVFSPQDPLKLCVREAYLKFYLKPRFLINHLKKIKSLSDIKLLMDIALDAFSFLS